MKRRVLNGLPLLMAGATLLGGAAAASAQATPSPPPSTPALDPAVLERLKAMSELLKGAANFTFTAKTFREQRALSGEMLAFYTRSTIAVARPNRVRVDSEGDLLNASLWYDGKIVTIYARRSAFYAQTEAPATIDEALAMLADRFQTPVPVTGFLLKDPYARMMEGVKTAFEVGLVQVDGVACRHLAFSEDDADWQLWIEDGPRPLPRRLAVTYKKIEGAPRVVSGLSDWNLAPTIPAGQFAFQAPAGVKKVDWAAVPK